jgi:hypothetical protein
LFSISDHPRKIFLSTPQRTRIRKQLRCLRRHYERCPAYRHQSTDIVTSTVYESTRDWWRR